MESVSYGCVQDCGISSAKALEIPQSCTKSLIYFLFHSESGHALKLTQINLKVTETVE